MELRLFALEFNIVFGSCSSKFLTVLLHDFLTANSLRPDLYVKLSSLKFKQFCIGVIGVSFECSFKEVFPAPFFKMADFVKKNVSKIWKYLTPVFRDKIDEKNTKKLHCVKTISINMITKPFISKARPVARYGCRCPC